MTLYERHHTYDSTMIVRISVPLHCRRSTNPSPMLALELLLEPSETPAHPSVGLGSSVLQPQAKKELYYHLHIVDRLEFIIDLHSTKDGHLEKVRSILALPPVP